MSPYASYTPAYLIAAASLKMAQPLRGILVAVIFIQTVLVECSIILWPALPLLLLPSPKARKIFLAISAWGQANWLGLAVMCLRFICGTRIYIHTKGQSLEELQRLPGDQLLLSNHPSRIDWMYHWALAIALGRLPKLKIVLKDSLRVAPGFGWAMQCNCFPFLSRRQRSQDLETLSKVSRLGGGVSMLLFPEGTDLSKSNLEKSHAHAAKENLQKYQQVLHPRTAGFDAVWTALKEVGSPQPPQLLNVTVAYVDDVPGELPNEVKLFAQGKCCKEVHLLVEKANSNVLELWKQKEEVLSKFYAPCEQKKERSGSGQLPDIKALAMTQSYLWEDVPGVRGRMLASALVALTCEALTIYALCWKPAMASVFFAVSWATFLALQKLAGGVDKVILQHAGKHPSSSKTD